jgi:hypothetical protein
MKHTILALIAAGCCCLIVRDVYTHVIRPVRQTRRLRERQMDALGLALHTPGAR